MGTQIWNRARLMVRKRRLTGLLLHARRLGMKSINSGSPDLVAVSLANGVELVGPPPP